MLKTQPRDELDRMARQFNQVIGSFWQWHGGNFSPAESWTPAINVYMVGRRVEVCVDLAGLKKETIDVHVEPGTLVIRGMRQAPEPNSQADEELRILCMEVDHGPFCRRIRLPGQVDIARVESTYSEGLLWVRLPLRDHG